MLWLIAWIIYGIIAIIAFVLIGVAEDLQSNENPAMSYDNLTLFGKIIRLIIRLILAALWPLLLIFVLIVFAICIINEKRLKSKIDLT